MNPSRLYRWKAGHSADLIGSLSFMRKGRGDFRPHLLLRFYSEHFPSLAPVLREGISWVKEKHNAHPSVAICACVDALNVIWKRRAEISMDKRAKQLRIKSQTYANARRDVEAMYRHELNRAERQFLKQ